MVPILLHVRDVRTGATTTYAFLRSPVRIGRRADNEVGLDEPSVSAVHGLVQFDAREVRYTDLGSRNGSVLDGRPLAPDAPALLRPGATLRLGPLALTWSRGGAPAPGAPGAVEAGGDSGPHTLAPGALTALMAQLAEVPAFGAAEAWAGSLRPGLTIGRFELLRELGRGGFGIVFEARDRQLGRRVALKALRPREDAPAAVREAWLQREGEAAAQLNHPHIASLYDIGRWEGGPYLILELLRGEGLDARLARGPLPLPEALQVAVDVARALAHAHAAGVVHRDLKPSNVFLTEGGWAKVLDFGLAHALGAGGQPGGGTPRYMAPEQRRDEPQDGRTDVYAAALVLLECLGAALPEPPGPPPAPPPGLPAALAALLHRALALDPASRPAGGAAWLEGLLAVQRGVRGSD